MYESQMAAPAETGRIETLKAYGLAGLAVGAALLLTLAIPPARQRSSYLLLALGVMISARRGLGPGLFATLLGAAMGDYFLIPPFYSLLHSPADLVPWLLFCSVGTAITWITHGLQMSKSRILEASHTLAKAQRRTDAILESISDGFIVFDREWRYTYVNTAGAGMLGTIPTELQGKNVWEVWPQLADSPFGAALRRAVAENVPGQVEAFYPEPLNRWYHIRCYPSRTGLTVFFKDVTERKQAEAALRESEERFRNIADTAPVLIWASGTDKRCTFFNKGWLEFTGRTLDQELGNGWAEGVHSDDLESCFATYSSAFDARKVFQVEYRLRRADGEYRWLLDNGVPRFSEGAFTGYIGSCIDITDGKIAAGQLRSLSASLIAAQEEERRRISRELHDDLIQRLALLAVDLGKLASPSASSPPPLREELRSLQERVVQTAELTRHIAHELHPMILEDLGIATALRALCEDVARREEIAIEFTGDNLPQSPKRETAACLYAIAQEALLNISKHARASRVVVELTTLDSSVSLSIADDGIGFPVEAASAGMGLGVVNMRERVRWLKGRFSLESQPGHGARITVQIPIAGETYEARARSTGR
jgi:PAS domain S-box-containing protein